MRCESGRAFRSRARLCSEASLLRTLGPFSIAPGVEGENLQHRASPVDEREPVPARRILAQQVAYQRRQAIEGTPHVRGPRAQPHALLRTGGQHDGARRNRNTIPPPSSGSTSQLARARSGQGAVQGVDLGEQPDVFAGVASSERVSRRRAPATDASANAVPGDEARHLSAGQPGNPGRELANDAFVRAAPPSIAESTQRPGGESPVRCWQPFDKTGRERGSEVLLPRKDGVVMRFCLGSERQLADFTPRRRVRMKQEKVI